MLLKRYWVEFEITLAGNYPAGLGYGCGVTAYDKNDALRILNVQIFKTTSIPPIKKVIEDVNLQSLDQEHVIPNMKPPLLRGVWFPLGYD